MTNNIFHDPFEQEDSKKKNVHFGDEESSQDVTFNEGQFKTLQNKICKENPSSENSKQISA